MTTPMPRPVRPPEPPAPLQLWQIDLELAWFGRWKAIVRGKALEEGGGKLTTNPREWRVRRDDTVIWVALANPFLGQPVLPPLITDRQAQEGYRLAVGTWDAAVLPPWVVEWRNLPDGEWQLFADSGIGNGDER